jgi:hypothetical protein
VRNENGLGLIYLNSTQWSSNSYTVPGKPEGLAVFNNKLFFVNAGLYNGLGSYNGTGYNGYDYPNDAPLITGNAIIVYQNELFVQGTGFTVYKYNGLRWLAVGNAFNGPIEKFYISSNDNLYAVGSFTGGVSKLSSNVWSVLGNGLTGSSPYVNDLVEFNDELYAGGSFSGSSSVNSPNLIKWNGISWIATAGTDGPVNALVVYSNKLIVAGSFGHIGLAPINNIGQYCTAGGNIVSGISNNVEEIKESILLNYPNPFAEETEIILKGHIGGYSQVRIVNLNGEIEEDFFALNNTVIKCGQKLSEGVFILEVVNAKSKQTVKIIKMK